MADVDAHDHGLREQLFREGDVEEITTHLRVHLSEDIGSD